MRICLIRQCTEYTCVLSAKPFKITEFVKVILQISGNKCPRTEQVTWYPIIEFRLMIQYSKTFLHKQLKRYIAQLKIYFS